MDNIIDLAKWKQPTGRAALSRSSPRNAESSHPSGDLRGKYGPTGHERSNPFPPRTNKSDSASRIATLWRDIRKTGTSLAEEFRVFAYAGKLSDNPDALHRDLRSLRAAFDLFKSRVSREGIPGHKGFHVLLGNDEASAWVNDDLFGWVLTLAANFTIAEAALLIEQRFRS
jgi:hypothetical protein